MNYRILLVGLFCGLFSIKSYGQDANAWSLDWLWEQALASYPSVEAYHARLNQTKINQKLIRRQYLPEILLQAQSTIGTQNTAGGAFFPLPGIYNVGGTGLPDGSGPVANLYGSAVLDWQFFHFGRQNKLTAAAETLTRQAIHQLNAEQLAVKAAVSRAYFDFLFHQQMEQWAAANAERLEILFEVSKSRAGAGLAPGADSMLVKASFHQTAAALYNWRGQLEESAFLLSMWTNVSLQQLKANKTSFPPAIADGGLTEEGAEAPAHPLLAARKEGVRHAEKLHELTASRILPSLSLLGGVQVRAHTSGQEGFWQEGFGTAYSDPVANYLLGIGLRWNLGNFFDYLPDRALSQEEVRQRKAATEEVALILRSRRQIAQSQIVRSAQQITSVDEAWQAAAEAYRQFEARYQSGLISISELLQIQDVLRKAEKRRLEVYYRYWRQQADLAEVKADFSILQNAFE